MPVAEGQVIQARTRRAVRRDRVGRVDHGLGQDALHAAVRQAQAQPARRCFGGVEPGRAVPVSVALAQRRRQDGRAAGFQQQRLRPQSQMHMGRHRAQALRTRPHAFGQGRIVVARDQHPGSAEARHGIEHAAYRALRHRLSIEHIAGHQHRIDPMHAGQSSQALHGCQARLGQGQSILGIEAAEQAADLPIGGVQESGHGLQA